MTELSFEQQQHLLDLARLTIVDYVENGHFEEIQENDPDLYREAGAFVTVKVNGSLRGCTGYMREDKPLFRVIREMAISAATSDPRFSPLRREELDYLTIGISVLSPMQKVSRVEDIRVGVHGLLINHRGRRGVLLPQVPTERGWDRETFLTNLCYKANLRGDDWKRGAVLYSFTAEVFGEN